MYPIATAMAGRITMRNERFMANFERGPAIYGQYVAAVVSVSQTVTREILVPPGIALIWREVSS
jgi:hypothetical protein